MKLPSLLSLAALSSIAVASCNSSTTPTDSRIGTIPKNGSYYVLSIHSTDSLGNEIAGTSTIRTTSALASGITIQGESNVTQFYDGNTYYWSFRQNGDVGVWNGASGAGAHPTWVTMPIQSAGDFPAIYSDTSWTYNGSTFRETETQKYTFLGSDQITVRGTSYPTARLAFDWYRNNGMKDPTDTIWFAPQLGFIVKERMAAGLNRYGNYISGSAADMINYQLQ